jgi:uncharacterized protein (DUF736 family)
MILGTFAAAEHGYTGQIHTLLLGAELSIIAAQTNSTENAPDWRVLLGNADTGIEIGAGWNRTGKRAGEYIALQIDDPAFARPVRANLIRSAQDDNYQLLWSRPAARSRK